MSPDASAKALPPARGRPPTTSPEQIAHAALQLFADRGFEATTVEDIAGALGVSRRTVFRYFPSKNDMVWGDFDQVLQRLRRDLTALDRDLPVMEALAEAVVSSNRYDGDQLPELRIRMALITTVPALQAHSMLRYAAWRAVVAEYVAGRRGERPSDPVPLTLGFVALAVSMAAFSRWVGQEGGDLEQCLRDGWAAVAGSYADG